MNDRDHFAAAALTGLTACGDYSVESTPVLAYRMADAMLRQRANHIPDAGKMVETPRTPQSDRLTEWERHGSRRWGLGVASDLYDLECRVAALERANHDAVPAAIAVSDEDRTDKAATSHRRDRSGDTPVTPVPYSRTDEQRVNWPTIRDTTQPRNGTPAEGSVQGDGTEPVAWAVVYPNGEVAVIAFKLQDAEERATASDRIVPLYRSPTLTDAEREAVEIAVEYVGSAFQVEHYAATLRGLLERLGGNNA